MNRVKRDYCSKGRHLNWRAWAFRDVENTRVGYHGRVETYHQTVCRHCNQPVKSASLKPYVYAIGVGMRRGIDISGTNRKQIIYEWVKRLNLKYTYTTKQAYLLCCANWYLGIAISQDKFSNAYKVHQKSYSL